MAWIYLQLDDEVALLGSSDLGFKLAQTEWVQRSGDVSVTGRFALDVGARVGNRAPMSLSLIHEHGERKREYRLEQPWLVPDLDEWRALIDAVPQLEWVESYGDFDLHTPAHAVSAWRLILVLRRRANS